MVHSCEYVGEYMVVLDLASLGVLWRDPVIILQILPLRDIH